MSDGRRSRRGTSSGGSGSGMTTRASVGRRRRRRGASSPDDSDVDESNDAVTLGTEVDAAAADAAVEGDGEAEEAPVKAELEQEEDESGLAGAEPAAEEDKSPKEAITAESSLRDVSKLLAKRPRRAPGGREAAGGSRAGASAIDGRDEAPAAAAEPALPSAPHVMIGEDGQIVVDQSTLHVTVDGARRGVGDDDISRYSGYTHVEEGETSLMGGSHRAAYSKRGEVPKRVERWSHEETTRFYQGLRVFGTDFTLLAGLFKKDGRDRRQVKAKYKKEERDHPELIDLALSSHLPLTEEDLIKAGVFVDGSQPSQPLGAPSKATQRAPEEPPADKRPRTSSTAPEDDEKDDEELERELFAEDEDEADDNDDNKGAQK